MITLTGQTTFERFNVYRDDVNPLQFYYMPQGPRIALDENGKPMFSLMTYRRDLSNVPEADRATKLGGGILAFSVELSAADDELNRLRAQLANDPVTQAAFANGVRTANGHFWTVAVLSAPADPAAVAKALILGMVPVDGGTVTIDILAEDGSHPGDFVSTLVGAGPVSMTGNERASCMAKLTMDGATAVADMVGKDLKMIRVAYTLNFNYRIEGLVVDAWCDAHKAYSALQNQMASVSELAQFVDDGGDHTFDHSKTTTLNDVINQSMTSGEFSGVTVTPSAPSDVIKPEYIQQLEQNAEDQIKQFIADTFTDYKPSDTGKIDDKDPDITTELPTVDGKKYGGDDIKYYSMKSWNDSMSATYHYHLSEQTVLPSQLNPNDNLSNVLNGQNVQAYLTNITLDPVFYKYLDVSLVCTADFDNDPINIVKAHLTYAEQGPQGPINEIDDYVFQKGGAPLQRFSTYVAGIDKQTYNYQYDIYYKGTTDKYSLGGQSNETVLVLNADSLGILKVDVQAGIVDWDQIRQVMVKMSYGNGSDQKSTEFTLDATHQNYKWTEVIGKPVTEPYTWSATFVDKTNQRIERPPVQQRGKLVIDQPIGSALDVTLVAVGSFGAQGLIEQIGVALKYVDTANNFTQNASFMLTKEGDLKEWKIPLVDDSLRTYQYQITVFYSGGVTRVDDWRTTDSTILPCGDPFGFKVTFLTTLLRAPWLFGTLKVWFDDPQTNIHAEETFAVKDFKSDIVWQFRLGAADRHKYFYQLTLFQADGTSYKSDPLPASEEVAVLQGPKQPAPVPVVHA
jgi:hypothetical protein